MGDLETLLEEASIANCASEPIHIPGAILPHGAMLVLDADTLEVLQCAGDLRGLLGTCREAIQGHSAEALFNPDQVKLLQALNAKFALVTPRHLLDPLLRVLPELPLDASLHRSGGALVFEFEAADSSNRYAADPLTAVQEMIEGFEGSISLVSLCQKAAERVRKVAGYDRVLVYRFMQDDSGWVIAESREPHLEPFLDLHYPAADIPKQARALYLKSWLRLITQVNYQPAPLIPPLNPRTGQPLDMSHAILRDVSPIHRQYLRNMGIDASMSISIIRGGKLWGLIACHHYSPRRLPRHLRAVCELFGSMFSLQLEARENGDRFNERLASRMVLQNLMLNLAGADDYAVGLTQQSPNLLDYIHGGETASGGRKGGVAVCVKGQLTFLGITPSQSQIEDLIKWLNVQFQQANGVYATDRLCEVWKPAEGLASVAAGILVISVSPEPSDYIIWFRPELVASVQWAGEPTKLVEAGPFGDQLTPRKSFDVWKETIVGRSIAWTPADVDAAIDLRISLLHVVLRRINDAARERKKASERDQILMAELDHRVKNTLANIQALVVHTSRSAASLTGFVEGLDGRLQSMAKAHSLLAQSRWEGVSIDKLMREELNPYQRPGYEIAISGPDIMLTPKSALSLSLAVHELATNAAKFGALGKLGGCVEVKWMITADRAINLSWIEKGGPAVEPPTRRGFGSTLIGRALAMETGGRASLQYPPSGVICEVFLPSSSVSDLGGAQPVVPKQTVTASSISINASESPYRILVVEDSFLIILTLEEIFSDLGWTLVGPATRLDKALLLSKTGTFDAALLDVNLAGPMSWPVAALLKDRDIPFAFSTGYDVNTVLPLDLAGTPVISKPFRTSNVADVLRKIILDHRGDVKN